MSNENNEIMILCENDDKASEMLRFSRMFLILSVIIAIVLQGINYFVAVNGGYDAAFALVLSLIPILGPLFCFFQLIFVGEGSPLILLLLFLACALTFLGWARFYDEYVCRKKIMSERKFNEIKDVEFHTAWQAELQAENSTLIPEPKAERKQMPIDLQPKPQPLPPVKTEPKSELLPPVKREPQPQPLPITKLESVKPETTFFAHTGMKAAAGSDEPEEYVRAVEDVLSILNKQKV